ncbi:hypothetical protein LCGC14_1793790 [marine sediment metagenome]|uniref:Uncharacterized protein n=1 Tax=marine sediment metagenome TaxID=412755 RepID=A0A0F9JRA7_9ZZZZ
MDLKLNNSELNLILTYIDDALTTPLEPLEKTTLMNIVGKINLATKYHHHQPVEEFAIAILNFEEAI